MPHKKKCRQIYQFYIRLLDISPEIWRGIQVSAYYNFWDLHVAIQDSMGWLDCHLHAFLLKSEHAESRVEIGIPGDEMGDETVFAGWEIAMKDYYHKPGQCMIYQYDFGDDWKHVVLLEDILHAEAGISYPRCIDGERACPPENCGGEYGYYEMLKILDDPLHPEHEDYICWLKAHMKEYYPYDPDYFDADEVHFDDPHLRWKNAFS